MNELTAEEIMQLTEGEWQAHSGVDTYFEHCKEMYIKIRTNNIVMDHQSTIEMVKMIMSEANQLTTLDF